MKFYYLLLGLCALVVLIRVAEAAAYMFRRQNEAVRKEDWLDLLLEALFTQR